MIKLRLLLIAIVVAILPGTVFAQSTTVSGTVTDSGGQTWNNGTYQFTFVPNPSYPNTSSYTWTGGSLSANINLSGALSGTGTYSQSVPSNNAISPSGSSWAIQFCPLATSPCYTLTSITIIGSSYSLNATPPAISINLILPTSGTQRAYSDGEITSAALGSLYFNVTSSSYRSCVAVSGQTCTTWSAVGGGGGGSPPGGLNHDTQCNNSGTFGACANNANILYVSVNGSDSNSGKTWDTSKFTIMAAVCALPGGNCSTNPKQAGAGTVYFTTGIACNSNGASGCWLATFGDSQYPNMTGAIGGPSSWTVAFNIPWPGINLICATMTDTFSNASQPGCTVLGPSNSPNPWAPLVWLTGHNSGMYIDGMSGTDGVFYTPTWGRIGIDSTTGLITGTPALTQTTSYTITNSNSSNSTNGGHLNAGPQLVIGNTFWGHLSNSHFEYNAQEACQVSAISRISNVVSVTTSGCGNGSSPTQCPFLNGDHLSIRDTTGDGTFNGTFTATSSCGATNNVTFNQVGPNFSASVGSNGIIADDRAFAILILGGQVEMNKMHWGGGGIKMYTGPAASLTLNDSYMEGGGTVTDPPVWLSPLLYGGGGTVDLSGTWMADAPLLPGFINDGGAQVFNHAYTSTSTATRGSAIQMTGDDFVNRTAGFLTQGQSGWYTNSYFEAPTDIARRQAPLTSNIGTNQVPQNPTAWTGSNFTTSSGKRDPYNGTGAIEIDATASTSAILFSATQAVNVGDYWYFGAWVRAVNSGFASGFNPIQFVITGAGNMCYGGTFLGGGTGTITTFTPMTGDGNWFWVTNYCQILGSSGTATLQMLAGADSTHAIQVYRPFVMRLPTGTASPTEIADEMNSIAFGTSTQAALGDLVYPADKRLGISSGSATNEFLGYLTHSNTANRTYTLPDATGTICITTTCGGISGLTTGQVAIAGSATTITSSKALQGTDSNVLSSGTVSGTAATLCTDANGGATTTGCTGGAISGMTTGQVAIAGSASSITSSKALQGTDSNVLTSSTVSGTGNLLCVDTGSGATTTGCTNGISGLTTGQIPVAGSATTLTSSKALQGTDSNILTSGTVSGTAAPLCTDGNGGATTSGCPATNITQVYNTQSSATNTNIAATSMVASTGALHSYSFSWTISLTAIGSGCSSSTTLNVNAIFTDPNTSSPVTELLGVITIAAGGNGTVGFVAQGTDNILAKSGTAVQYSTSGYTAGTGCTVNPTYQLSPTLVQLW